MPPKANTTVIYPCVLPRPQQDVKCTRAVSDEPQVSLMELVHELFDNCHHIIADALLYEHGAITIPQIACCVQQLHKLDPAIRNGQIYLAPMWRLRHGSMTSKLQRMVRCVQPHARGELLKAITQRYDAQRIQRDIFTRIGPARAAGVQSCLTSQLLPPRHEAPQT